MHSQKYMSWNTKSDNLRKYLKADLDPLPALLGADRIRQRFSAGHGTAHAGGQEHVAGVKQTGRGGDASHAAHRPQRPYMKSAALKISSQV